MISEKIDKLIMEAMKSGDSVRKDTMRMLKAKFTEYRTAENAKPLDEAAEITIIRKMVAQRNEAAEMYEKAGRSVEAEKEKAEAAVLNEFLPAPITEAQIFAAIAKLSTQVEPVKKNMGAYMKALRAEFPTADGKMVSACVNSKLS